MRGSDSYINPVLTRLKWDGFAPIDHPRLIRNWLYGALARMDDAFARMYEADVKGGRPSIALEKLVRALFAAGEVLDS
jgi:hypothetical protein